MSIPSSTKLVRPPSLEEFKKRRTPLLDYSQPEPGDLRPLNRLAVWITGRVGTIGFFLIIFGWTVLWLGWNLLAPASWRFDPPMGFVFWLFISNVIQILLMPLIMLGQNIQGRHSERRAQHDLEVNVRAEEEIETILNHLEYQNSLLIVMVQKLGLKMEEAEGQGTAVDIGFPS
jgi:uncharacterized membrane protein